MLSSNGSYTYLNGVFYRLIKQINSNSYILKSEKDFDYPSLILDRKDIKNAFFVILWVRYKGCDAVITNGIEQEYLTLNVRPSQDVEILGAVEVERGVFNVDVPIDLIEKAWEERIPLNGFEFPKEIEKYKEISLTDFIPKPKVIGSITDFQYITNNGVVLSTNLGVRATIFEGNDQNEIKRFYESNESGLRWKHNGQVIQLFEDSIFLKGYPSHDYQKILVIFPVNHHLYREPNNAVIYNANGTSSLQLIYPELISNKAKELKVKFPDGPFLTYFENVSWEYNNKGEIITCISLAFNRDWRERRVLNTETGEFGECIDSGMI